MGLLNGSSWPPLDSVFFNCCIVETSLMGHGSLPDLVLSPEGYPTFATVSDIHLSGWDGVVTIFPGSLPPSARDLVRTIVLISLCVFASLVVFAGYRLTRMFLISLSGMISASVFFAIFRERGAMDFELGALIVSTVAVGLVGSLVGGVLLEASLVVFGVLLGGGLGVLSLPFMSLFLPPVLRLAFIVLFGAAVTVILFLYKRISVIVLSTLIGSPIATTSISLLAFHFSFVSLLFDTLAALPEFNTTLHQQTGVMVAWGVCAGYMVFGLLLQFFVTARKPVKKNTKKTPGIGESRGREDAVSPPRRSVAEPASRDDEEGVPLLGEEEDRSL